MDTIELFLPIITVSEANCSEHWTKKSLRHKKQRQKLRQYMQHIKVYPLPCMITFRRVADVLLDSDNLQMSMKYLRDEIADIILGNVYSKPSKNAIGRLTKRLYGRNDSDTRLHWSYQQTQGKVHGVWLTIEAWEDPIPISRMVPLF